MLQRPTNSMLTIRPPDGAGALLIDAPLRFKTYSAKGEGRSPQHHYTCMNFAELAALPIAEIAAADAFIFSWIPLRSAFLAKPLMAAWGFKFSGSAFVWIKTHAKSGKFCFGGGYGTRKNAEVCWLGRRGHPKRKSKSVRELLIAPRREHRTIGSLAPWSNNQPLVRVTSWKFRLANYSFRPR
jgi:N6-adenosine-specific RNA methylase IME4